MSKTSTTTVALRIKALKENLRVYHDSKEIADELVFCSRSLYALEKTAFPDKNIAGYFAAEGAVSISGLYEFANELVQELSAEIRKNGRLESVTVCLKKH